MAQAGSAQREPSMEEILASIRRIIEDNDSGRKPESAISPASDPVDFEVERVANTVVAVDAFRAELQAVPPVRPETKGLTLQDVQAQVVEEAPANEDFPELKAGNDAGSPTAQSPADEVLIDQAAFDEAETEIVEPVAARDLSLQDLVRPEAPPLRPAIISEHASRQVAAAFGELSEAFAARSKKTFDEMAEEMLRPMLQDWLDNNLPTLVERLVREEIERVARGAQ